MEKQELVGALDHTLQQVRLDWPYEHGHGKVRDWFSLPNERRLLVTTDRLSAFDRVLAEIPYKGQVLNQLSAFWFRNTRDVVANHLIEVPHPNVSLVHDCTPLPVEVIVRGYITGVTNTALWTLYAAGNRAIYGHQLPDGLEKNDPLPEPLITPTTKAGPGEHDERLTCDEVVSRGLVEPALWARVQQAALAIFRRGMAVAQEAGFRLVDTKYEFGISKDGELTLIDEVHTPDSSRFWRLAEAAGDDDGFEHWDKEFVRLWYAERGYRGDGEPPALPDETIVALAQRYIGLYEGLTGETFEPASPPVNERIVEKLQEQLKQ